MGKGIVFLTVLFLAVFAFPVFAQPDNSADSEDSADSEEIFNNNLGYQVSYIPSSNLNTGSGKVEIVRHKVEFANERRLYGKIPVKFSLNSERINISQDTMVEIPRSLRSVEAEFEITLPALTFEDTYFRLKLCPSFYGDTWSFESSSFRMPINMFLIHKINERLFTIAGFGVYPDFDTLILPIFGLIYRPNDYLYFNLTPPRPSIEYKASEKVTLFVAGQGDFNNEYEVKTRDRQDGNILTVKEIDLLGGMKYAFNKNVRLSTATGWAFSRMMKYEDSLGKLDIKSGLYSEIKLEARF